MFPIHYQKLQQALCQTMLVRETTAGQKTISHLLWHTVKFTSLSFNNRVNLWGSGYIQLLITLNFTANCYICSTEQVCRKGTARWVDLNFNIWIIILYIVFMPKWGFVILLVQCNFRTISLTVCSCGKSTSMTWAAAKFTPGQQS